MAGSENPLDSMHATPLPLDTLEDPATSGVLARPFGQPEHELREIPSNRTNAAAYRARSRLST